MFSGMHHNASKYRYASNTGMHHNYRVTMHNPIAMHVHYCPDNVKRQPCNPPTPPKKNALLIQKAGRKLAIGVSEQRANGKCVKHQLAVPKLRLGSTF